MAKWEINRQLNWVSNLTWIFIPWVEIKVKWPRGVLVQIDESMPQWDWTIGPSKYLIESSDPNDHYRPWLETNVGKQSKDWDWYLSGNDVTEDRLTIRIRKSKEQMASIAVLRWS